MNERKQKELDKEHNAKLFEMDQLEQSLMKQKKDFDAKQKQLELDKLANIVPPIKPLSELQIIEKKIKETMRSKKKVKIKGRGSKIASDLETIEEKSIDF